MCPHCGAPTVREAARCPRCGAPSMQNVDEVAPAVALSVTTPPSTARPRRRPSARLAAAVVAALAAVVGGGAYAARTLTVTLVSPSGSVADLLPAGTVLYASLAVRPGGDQGANLRTLTAAFTGQPGFSRIREEIAGQLVGSGACTGTVRARALADRVLSWADGTAAIAVTDPAVLRAHDAAGARDGVVGILGLRVQLSIADIVTQQHLGSAAPAGEYNGVAIYALAGTPGCGPTGRAASGYAALIHGHAVIGATRRSVEREIDVARGTTPALSASATYRRATAALPPDGLAYLYVDTAAIIKQVPGARGTLAGISKTAAQLGSGPQIGAAGAALGPTALSIAARPTGFDLQAVQISTSPLPNAGGVTPNRAASAVPDGTLFYLSLDNLKGTYAAAVASLKANGLIDDRTISRIQRDYGDALSLLDGEVAVALLPLDARAASAASPQHTDAVPLVALLDVSAHPGAAATSRRLLRTLIGDSPPFAPMGTVHGFALYGAPAGYGFTQIRQWLVFSTAIEQTSAALSHVLYDGGRSLASGAQYALAQQALGAGKTGLMFMDLSGIRTTMEGLFGAPASDTRRQYDRIRPLLVPLRAMAFSSSAEDGGRTSRSDLFIAIAP